MEKEYDFEGGAVRIKSDRVLRLVPDIRDSAKILEVLEAKGLHGPHVVETKISNDTENLLEHKFITPIIHSGEYTSSMAYDVTEKCIDMAIELLDENVYSFDLLPHNYTYHNGEWLLYDFGALELHSKNFKTEIRNIFKISFSAFELLKIIPRKSLKHYFLNRIKTGDLFAMIPLHRFIIMQVQNLICRLLYIFKGYKLSLRALKHFYNLYKKNYKREFYFAGEIPCAIYERISEISAAENETLLCIGEESARWAISHRSELPKVLYIDDYGLCDRIYNTIYQNKMRELSAAVISPLVDEEEIPENYQYRGIYDCFAKERFVSDSVIMLNFDLEQNLDSLDINKFITNLSDFSRKKLLLSVKNECHFIDEIRAGLCAIFKNVQCESVESQIIFVAKDKIIAHKDVKGSDKYRNNNRIADAQAHSAKILEILRTKS